MLAGLDGAVSGALSRGGRGSSAWALSALLGCCSHTDLKLEANGFDMASNVGCANIHKQDGTHTSCILPSGLAVIV